MKLEFNVGIVSLAGFYGTYPRGFGNYFSINYQGDNAMVVNLSYEDYEDVMRKNLTPDGIECKVFGYNGSYAIYVTDERIHAKARSCFHTYRIPKELVVNVIRSVYNMEPKSCIVEERFELARYVESVATFDHDSKPGFLLETKYCACCKKLRKYETAQITSEEPKIWKTKPESGWTVETDKTTKIFSGEEVGIDIANSLLGNN